MDERIHVLADFLILDVNELILWSDDSITIRNNHRFEYIVTPEERNGYMEHLGVYKGYNIYKN